MRAFAALALALKLALWASAACADWRGDVQPARLVGEGDFSVFGFTLYRAQLWSERTPVDYDARFALHIVYTRSITRERLAQTGLGEIRRLAAAPIPAETLARWRADMLRAFADVVAGDQLSAVYLPDKGVRFYSGERMTAEFDDPVFARAFFGIWLDPATRAPDLRRQLLGIAQ
ncbi:chalcone isomerase family protein [Paraburkholderia ginsengisoli]|uniref:Chalcone isomerase family protein n=1 Tax=Paraburkholderia ginsengisoli TaxID=311231 RepID=A0A7T4N4Y8_9BURK|nr:chalcone isomerase family protein [Paraburkholderia ginsengisoli]QQC65349.1 chalcone isomerase family protein [Paraburkholderia ginsengisoli]